MTRGPWRLLIAGTAYTVAMAAVAVVAAWPVYADARFVWMSVLAVLGALLLAAAARMWRWRGWMLALGTGGLFVVLGLAVAVPTLWTDAAAVIGALRDLGAGAVTGFKDLVTVDLPVGGYRNLLVPALMVMLGGTLLTVLLAWRDDRLSALAAIPALGMPLFGLLFGRTATSAPWRPGPLVIAAPVELAVGAAALVATVSWLAWRSAEERRSALRRAAAVSGVRVSRRRSGSDVRRRVLAGGMIAVAVVVAAATAPAVAATRSREVLRSGTGPLLAVSRAVSPLAQYRGNFSDAAYDRVLFRVEAVEGAMPDRIRIATLTSYDGAVYRVADPSGVGSDARFTRVPSRLPGGDGAESGVRIEIDGLQGIWLPTFGALEQIDFAGSDASDLSDAFYYNAATRSAVETSRGGLKSGDAYTLIATTAPAASIAGLEAPGADPAVTVPDSVRTWIERQGAGSGGAALQALIDRLRERGYLSHALEAPPQPLNWMSALGDAYAFQPSAAGHSLARVDAMFQKLLERQVAAAAGSGSDSLVAAVGDDEQFAVAAALIAEHLGFPARVVVGVRLTGADDGVPSCVDGVCRGGNVTAWLEVGTRDGSWVSVDVTPQHEAGVDTAVTRERDPEVPTDVRPEAAQEVVPPDPIQQDQSDSDDPVDAGADLGAVWAVLRITGALALALGMITGPLLVIVAAKALRRRGRRTATDVETRIVGGWDEYVDAAVDSGLPPPRMHTRSELAQRYATAQGAALAVTADRAVFSGAGLTTEASDEFWHIVDSERERFAASVSLWRRLLAAVSLNSFTRDLAPRRSRGGGRTPHGTERRRRRVLRDAR